MSLSISQASDSANLAWAHPLVREWFAAKFGTPTEPQEQGWPHILADTTHLSARRRAPGKRWRRFWLASTDWCARRVAGELDDRTEVLYVSPLKALGNDIHKNLEESARRNSANWPASADS